MEETELLGIDQSAQTGAKPKASKGAYSPAAGDPVDTEVARVLNGDGKFVMKVVPAQKGDVPRGGAVYRIMDGRHVAVRVIHGVAAASVLGSGDWSTLLELLEAQ